MKNSIIALKLFIVLTIITGAIYPLAISGIARIAFSDKANGSMISQNNKIVGSVLIGQQFTRPEFFWGRPSAINNNPMPSGGSNLNPIGDTLKAQIMSRIDNIRKYHGNLQLNQIPKDLLFASGSGVDPHISPEAVYFQIGRVAAYRHLTSDQKNKLSKIIQNSIQFPDLYIFGESRINVLELNLKLMEL